MIFTSTVRGQGKQNNANQIKSGKFYAETNASMGRIFSTGNKNSGNVYGVELLLGLAIETSIWNKMGLSFGFLTQNFSVGNKKVELPFGVRISANYGYRIGPGFYLVNGLGVGLSNFTYDQNNVAGTLSTSENLGAQMFQAKSGLEAIFNDTFTLTFGVLYSHTILDIKTLQNQLDTEEVYSPDHYNSYEFISGVKINV